MHLSSYDKLRRWHFRARPAQKLVMLFAALCFLAAGSGLRAAQAAATGSLHGATTVFGSNGQSSILAGVAIKLTGNTRGLPTLTAYSDNTGKYEFTGIPAGGYTLEAEMEGFQTLVRKVTVVAEKDVAVNLPMRLKQLQQRIEVRGSVPVVSPESTTPPTQTLKPRQLQTIPVIQQEVKRVLPVTPGVIRMQNGQIFIKGVSEGQSMLLLDSAQAVDPITGNFSIDVPIDAIQSLNVYKAPFQAQYGGFVGGMTNLTLKSPPSQWHMVMHDLNPSIRGKAGHMVGFSRATPRIRFGGPLWKGKINFAESFLYELRKPSVRGLAWPNDGKKTQGYNSITNFQFILSPRNVASLAVNLFPRRYQWANLNVLIPRPATADRGQRGYSIDGSDSHQFGSGGILNSFFKYISINTYAHGHGPADMLLSPTVVGGNYFNSWKRSGQQEQGQFNYTFPSRQWLGKHEFSLGVDFIHRNFNGTTQSHPVLLLRNDGTAAERIDFTDPARLAAADSEFAGFGQDHWILNNRLALTLGLRGSSQTNGDSATFAPRLSFVYALDPSAKTVLRGGIGTFYDRTPLLAADFAANPQQIITPLGPDSSPIGPSVPYQNVCSRAGANGLEILSGCSHLGSTPDNVTWRVQITRRLSRHLSLEASTLYSHTSKIFVINPVTSPESARLMLSNQGSSRYHEYEFTMNYRPSENADLSLSYVRSSSRGNLNTVGDIFVPFQVPVIRPDAYAKLPSDVPNRLTGFGSFKLPWGLTLSPSVDLHSGFPYSNVNLLQDYVGKPNSERYPIYFSLNWRIYKTLPIPFHIHPGHTFRLGIYSINTTSHRNPTAIYNNITSPYFGNFTGFNKRINGIIIEFSN